MVRSLTTLDFGGTAALVLDHSHTSISVNRNMLTQLALDHPARITHLFFLDTDMSLPRDAVLRLLSAQRPLVSGLYVDKKHDRVVARRLLAPFRYQSLHEEWCVANATGDAPSTDSAPSLGHPHWFLKPQFADRVVECDATGAGCLLIERQVLEAVPFPWFEEEHDPQATRASAAAMVSEDYSFFRKAAERGFPCAVDTGVLCYHWSEMSRHPPYWKAEERVS